ncbi:hypothetical protein DNTS_021709, partial [Danionella cerebrum]
EPSYCSSCASECHWFLYLWWQVAVSPLKEAWRTFINVSIPHTDLPQLSVEISSNQMREDAAHGPRRGGGVATLPDTAVSSYAASLKEKGSLVPALYKVIRENFSDLLEPVCHQLFEFYRSADARLQRFTLQFLPELIWSFLSVTAGRDAHRSGCIEALLLAIYNLEIVDKDGQSKILSFTIPSLSKPSVYHEPSSIGSLALTEGALANHGLSRVVYSGPHLQRETFTAQNRFEVLTFLLLCYNASLSYMSSSSLQSLCQLSSRVSICGYPRQQVRRYKGISTRLMVTSEFLVQLVTGIHFALCNGELDMGSKALDDVLYRAQLELFPEALLVGNAIKSSLHGASLKNNKDGARCIQVEITPTASRISRNAVTSLSIRGHRWKRHEINVTGVSGGERLLNGEAPPRGGRLEGEGLPPLPRDAVDLGSPDELTEITELDEGICAQSSPPAIVISASAVTGKPSGKGLRRLTSRSSREKEKEKDMDQLSRKQAAVRAVSENMELLSIKRLTLTASQSVPKSGGTLSLSRTASAVFSRSFEQVSNALQPSSRSSSPTPNHLGEQEEGVAYLDHLSPAHQHRQRSPTISFHVTSDL